jgi:hypothetical protein
MIVGEDTLDLIRDQADLAPLPSLIEPRVNQALSSTETSQYTQQDNLGIPSSAPFLEAVLEMLFQLLLVQRLVMVLPKQWQMRDPRREVEHILPLTAPLVEVIGSTEAAARVEAIAEVKAIVDWPKLVLLLELLALLSMLSINAEIRKTDVWLSVK